MGVRHPIKKFSLPRNQPRPYVPEPTMDLFHRSNAGFRCVMGPIGSGKTYGSAQELMYRAAAQRPDAEGVRRSRCLILRNTYDQLQTTTIKTFRECLRPDIFKIKMSAPPRGTLTWNVVDPATMQPDGTRVECEVLFMAIDRIDDMRKLLSLELTFAFFNEIREFIKILVDTVLSRLGRYPAKKDGGPSWTGAWADTNPPDEEHWFYRWAELGTWKSESTLFRLGGDVDEEEVRRQLILALGDAGGDEESVQKVLRGMRETTLGKNAENLGKFEFFRQPGALLRRPDGKGYIPNPKAENVDNQPLGYQYWLNALNGKDSEWIKTMILSEYGSVFTGRPVYEGVWSPTRHVAKEPLPILSGLPIWLGFDFWHTPSCTAAQLLPNGQLRFLREWHMVRSGLKQFLEEALLPGLRLEFPDCKIGGGWGDPSGQTGSQIDRHTNCFSLLRDYGMKIKPIGNNRYEPRRGAFLDYLRRNVGSEPALLIDPSCRMLIKGCNGGYRFDRVRSAGGADVFQDKPCKDHPISDICESAQYLCLGIDGRWEVEAERRKDNEMVAAIDHRQAWLACQ